MGRILHSSCSHIFLIITSSVLLSDISMAIPFYILFLPILIFAQSCCNNQLACPANASCLCQDTVNSCIYEIVQDNTNFLITNQTSYFNWVPSTGEFLSVTINFCALDQNNKDGEFRAGFKIQNPDATGYPQDFNISFSIVNSCYEFLMPGPKFCTTPSGGYCNLIVSLKLAKGSSSDVQINVSYVEGLTKHIILILIAVGCVLLLVIVILVACMIRKRMMGDPQEVKNENIVLDHFQKYVPIVKLFELIQNSSIPLDIYSCSVCLGQIKMEQEVRKTLCGHIFHVECMDHWCVRNLSCPMCRQPLDQSSLVKKRQQISVSSRLMGRKIENVTIRVAEETNQNITSNH